ncbi:MAG: 30S ribosomal protein S24e [Candidatus Methanomethylophilaceae archaeon]|jgi:small subunit ribosomal protein S24e|nr:30S ribosomal protein S24e [Candidatus Methanomethylophilaceae archaeon]NLF33729.1 30S ribosomal protein S24e [Thermoplasmatales archaeon]
MKMEITEKRENPLLKRVEVYFTIDHTGESTPGRNAVGEEIAKQMKSKRDQIVVNNLDTIYGRGITKGYAKVYETKEAALQHEREYLLKRNGIEAPKPEPAEKPAE